MIDQIYRNHPGLDPIYKGIFETYPDIYNSIEQLEVCDRNGNITLAIWLVNGWSTHNKFVPFILELFKGVLTPPMIQRYNYELGSIMNSDLIIVNPDKFKGILRFYYRDGLTIHGVDINKEGDVEKVKEYSGSMGGVLTVHTYPNGDVKKTYATQTGEVIGYPGCEITISRDDGFIYYLYLPLCTYK
jgi:hypothetical protein